MLAMNLERLRWSKKPCEPRSKLTISGPIREGLILIRSH